MVQPILITQAQLERAWHDLMGPWSFGCHTIWMMLIVDDRPLPHLTEIEDAQHPPDSDQVAALAELLTVLGRDVAPGARVAFLRSRPGKGTITGADRAWASRLYAAARRADVPCEVVHLATRGEIRPIPADVVGMR